MARDVGRIPRYKKNPEIGQYGAGSLNQIGPLQRPRHHYVCQQKIRLQTGMHCHERSVAGLGLYDLELVVLQLPGKNASQV